MINIEAKAKIVKADVTHVDNSVITLQNVVITIEDMKALYRSYPSKCTPLSNAPMFVIPTLTIQAKDRSIELPYSVAQDIRRMQNAHISR